MLILLPTTLFATPFDRDGLLLSKIQRQSDGIEKAEELDAFRKLYQNNDRLVIKGADNFINYRTDCSGVDSYLISLENNFDCLEETIKIKFEKINADNKSSLRDGFLLPFSSNKKILLEPRTSKICRFIKR